MVFPVRNNICPAFLVAQINKCARVDMLFLAIFTGEVPYLLQQQLFILLPNFQKKKNPSEVCFFGYVV